VAPALLDACRYVDGVEAVALDAPAPL